MIAAKMNTTPTLVFVYENPKHKNRKKVKNRLSYYCLCCYYYITSVPIC